MKHYDALEYTDFMQNNVTQCSAMYIWYDMDILNRIVFNYIQSTMTQKQLKKIEYNDDIMQFRYLKLV